MHSATVIMTYRFPNPEYSFHFILRPSVGFSCSLDELPGSWRLVSFSKESEPGVQIGHENFAILNWSGVCMALWGGTREPHFAIRKPLLWRARGLESPHGWPGGSTVYGLDWNPTSWSAESHCWPCTFVSRVCNVWAATLCTESKVLLLVLSELGSRMEVDSRKARFPVPSLSNWKSGSCTWIFDSVEPNVWFRFEGIFWSEINSGSSRAPEESLEWMCDWAKRRTALDDSGRTLSATIYCSRRYVLITFGP